jgi:gliding motility-associated-like protein
MNRPNIRLKTCPTLPDPANYTFDGTPTGAGLSSATAQNPYALPQVTTDFQLVVTDLNGGCTDTVITHIDVLCDTCQAPIPALTDVTCFGGSDGEIFATPYGINGPPFDVRLIEPITLTVLQQDNAVVTNVTFSGLTAGDYIVRSYDTTGCWADTLVTINEPPIMTLSATPDTIVCIGGTAVMSATAVGGNSANYTYNWSGLAGTTSTQNATPTAVTAYDVYALDPMGCSSDTLTINVNMYPPILTTIGLTDTVCPGFSGVVSVQANGGYGGQYSYAWSDEAGNVVGNLNVANVTPVASPATYYVIVTDACETPAKLESLNVYWYEEPQPSFTADVLSGCFPIEVNFTNTTDPNMVDQCYWDFGNGTTSNVCGTQNVTFNGVGILDVSLTVTSADGCVGDTTYVSYIETYDYPDAAFSIFPNPINVLEPTTNMYDSSSADVTSYEWNFGDHGFLGTSNLQNPEFTFPDLEPANYDVELIVTNQHGCTDTAYSLVVMNGVYNFYVPTGFTPNGDGVNDYFYPQGEGVDALEYEMIIFDRWGRIVFETTDTQKQWDGNKLGMYAPEGVYVWKIFTKDQYTGSENENIGNVTIVI